MLGTFIILIALGLGLFCAVGVATLWAEFGGWRRPPDVGGQEADEDTEGGAEGDERPWERPGAVRLDCEPDRGTMLLSLGRVSLWLIAGASVLSVLALLPVIPLAVAVLVMASGDLKKMSAGAMDPAGEPLTLKAGRYAIAALATLFLVVLGIGGLVALVATSDM